VSFEPVRASATSNNASDREAMKRAY
jgi:hypothetical protein